MHRSIMFRCIIFPSLGECKFKSAPVGANVLADEGEEPRREMGRSWALLGARGVLRALQYQRLQ